MCGLGVMAQGRLCILLFQPFTIYLLFCFLLSRELWSLPSACAWFIQQGGWSWDHHRILTEVSVALRSQETEGNIMPVSSPLVLEGSLVNEMEYRDNLIWCSSNTCEYRQNTEVMVEPVHWCSPKCLHQPVTAQGRVSLAHPREAPQTILPLEQIQLF